MTVAVGIKTRRCSGRIQRRIYDGIGRSRVNLVNACVGICRFPLVWRKVRVNVCHLIELEHQSPFVEGLWLRKHRSCVVGCRYPVGSCVYALEPITHDGTAK
jgi:hypothetical protein